MDNINIYTDGACSGNPGPGGWASIIIYSSKIIELSGGSLLTTNNRMEMTAVIKGLENIKNQSNVIINTDSKYVINGMTSWIEKWKKNKWLGSNKKLIKNKDLWEKIYSLNNLHNTKWIWIKGHSGNSLNEKVDQLARSESEKFK